MADPVLTGLAATAGLLAAGAAVLIWPRPPALDGERWFKITLASLFLGELDAKKAPESEWAERLLRFVPYHPAGRLPERKVVQPLAEPPGARLEGERALQEALRVHQRHGDADQELDDLDRPHEENHPAQIAPLACGHTHGIRTRLGKSTASQAATSSRLRASSTLSTSRSISASSTTGAGGFGVGLGASHAFVPPG